MLVLMTTETYEQVQLSAKSFWRTPSLPSRRYGMVVVEYHEEEALYAFSCPRSDLQIVREQSRRQGQTAANPF